ncbi:SRPBCC family protein [Natrarchaeobius chitinivorans]|uniref:SRPBCC family protein n=1 Tax=Natrarchaeobius chitinivorans TaxID=1679083 RepID=A0A3N6M1J7_NATCH|nr:SRPBCC family protein [Natrarchaeobius chitinivorans]RQG97208.1 hypothetical protein EA473_03815 [Natrarchaeobius chitinivorans]
MTTFEHEVSIETPVEYSFEWGLNPENWQRSMPGMTDVEVLGETDEGTRHRTTFKMLGQTSTDESTFIVVEPNEHAYSRIEGPDMFGEMHYRFSETPDGSLVRFEAEFEDPESLVERALQPVFNRYLDRQFRNHLQTMKELVEAEYAETEAVMSS